MVENNRVSGTFDPGGVPGSVVSGSGNEYDLTFTRSADKTRVDVALNNKSDKCFSGSLGVYKMYDGNIANQQYFSGVDDITFGPGVTRVSANLPTCMAQIDLFGGRTSAPRRLYGDDDELLGYVFHLNATTSYQNPVGPFCNNNPQTPSGAINASPNPCSITAPLSTCVSNITWTTNNVDSAEVRVSKNGGPAVVFSSRASCVAAVCPANFITAEPDYFDFKLYGTKDSNTSLLGTVRVTGRVVTPPDRQPNGNFDDAVCNSSTSYIVGWAFDPDSSSSSIDVHIYRDGPAGGGGIFEGVVRADQFRPDVNAAFGITGNHGFYKTPLPAAFRDGLAHQVYVYAINSNGIGPNPLLSGSPKPVQCPVPPVCPEGPGASVVLLDKIVQRGQTTTAVAPNGWTGGSFVSSNTGVATVGAVQGQVASVSAVGVGNAFISGRDWTANNGATGCSLRPDTIFVEDAPIGTLASLSNSPLEVCSPKVTAVATIRATSNVFAEARVYGARGLSDGTVVFAVLAGTARDYTTGDWVKEGTVFKLFAPFNGNALLAQLTMRVNQKDCTVPPPIVDLTANPNPVNMLQTTELVWQQRGGPADECHATAGPGFSTGGDIKGTDTSAPLVGDVAFTIVCTGPGGSDTKTVVVAVKPPVGGQPISSWVDNTNTATASGLTVSCGQILATWTKAEKPVDGYRIYYYNSDIAAWRLVKEVPRAEAQTFAVGGSDRLGKAFSPPSESGAYRYRVYTYVGALEGVANKDAQGSPIAAVPCDDGTGDLSPSNKDITKIRNVQLSYNTLVNQDSNVGPALPVIEGDSVSFAINLVNGGTEAISTPIKVDDVMTNLAQPAKGFGLHASCEDDGQCALSVQGYDATTHRLSMTVTPLPGQSLAPKSAEAWSITFTAKTQAPSNKRGQPFRFQNKGYVNGVTGPLLITPYILVLPAGTPTIEEIQ
jgi:hypothetical protein